MTNIKRSRAYCFTWNNPPYYGKELLEFRKLYEPTYLVYGLEYAPTTGTPHLQGYIYFENAHTIKQLAKRLKGPHFIVAKGDVESNFDYCTKDGEYIEIGERPQQGRARFEIIEKAMNDPRDNFHVYNQYRRAYREYKHNTFDREKKREVKLCQISNKYKHLPEAEQTCLMCDGAAYTGEEYVILDLCDPMPKWYAGWKHDHPIKYKNGFEYMYMDPRCVIWLYYPEKDRLPDKLKTIHEFNFNYVFPNP